MSDLHDYQVDHLLLLVSSNPLPNAVAGRLLVKPGGRITFIHSEDSFSLAKRLERWLPDTNASHVSFKYGKVDESDARSVYRKVRDALNAYEKELSSANKAGVIRVGLNYTGGTKVMSVHAYRAVQDWETEKSHLQEREAFFSYLDASTLRMSIDSAPDGPYYVGRAVEISIDNLLTLHDWKLDKKPSNVPLLPKSAAALLAINSDPVAAPVWRAWLRDEVYGKAKSNEKWKSSTELQQLEMPWPNVLKLEETLREELGQANARTLKLTMWPQQGKDSVIHFGKWLDGIWLESAVLSVLQQIPQKMHLKECCTNLLPYISTESGRVFFEFDVVAVRGYQLFAFSCTTTDDRKPGGRARLKQKLFEGSIRARQMGGDEACAALVCCMEQKEADLLAQEVRGAMGLGGRIRVFGRQDLANLSGAITAWIREQRGKEE